MLTSARVYSFWLALFRIAVGLFWLAHAIPKFTEQQRFLPPNGFMARAIAMGMSGTAGPYHGFLANVVAPHAELFAQLVRAGEALTGAALVLGLLTRLGGLGGMFLAANYMLSKGTFGSVAAGWSSLDGAAFLMSALNFVLPTGRALGIDWFLMRPRAPHRPVMTIPSEAAPTAATSSGAPVHAEFVDEHTTDDGGTR